MRIPLCFAQLLRRQMFCIGMPSLNIAQLIPLGEGNFLAIFADRLKALAMKFIQCFFTQFLRSFCISFIKIFNFSFENDYIFHGEPAFMFILSSEKKDIE
jgi:hypothetical protein